MEFQQDNAKGHAAKYILEVLEACGIKPML